MMRLSDPEWLALERKILAWDERIRARERDIQALHDRLRELEQRLGVIKRRLALGTGVMASVASTELPAVRHAS